VRLLVLARVQHFITLRDIGALATTTRLCLVELNHSGRTQSVQALPLLSRRKYRPRHPTVVGEEKVETRAITHVDLNPLIGSRVLEVGIPTHVRVPVGRYVGAERGNAQSETAEVDAVGVSAKKITGHPTDLHRVHRADNWPAAWVDPIERHRRVHIGVDRDLSLSHEGAPEFRPIPTELHSKGQNRLGNGEGRSSTGDRTLLNVLDTWW